MSKILLVEDEATVRNTLALNLRAEGHEVLTAEAGSVGLSLAREQTPDLIILDLMLPELDAFPNHAPFLAVHAARPDRPACR